MNDKVKEEMGQIKKERNIQRLKNISGSEVFVCVFYDNLIVRHYKIAFRTQEKAIEFMMKEIKESWVGGGELHVPKSNPTVVHDDQCQTVASVKRFEVEQ